jgi:hypothetical protein
LKFKFSMVGLVLACLLVPHLAGATTVFETTEWIIGTDGAGFTYDFVADTAPFTYSAALSDLSESDVFGLESLYLSITTSTDPVGSIFGPGSFTFEVEGGETYYANVFGVGSGEVNAGLFGIEIKAVPIPPSFILLGSCALGLVLLRRKVR